MLYFADYKGADDALREAQRVLAACVGRPRGEDGRPRAHRLEVRCKAQIAEKSWQQGRFREADSMYAGAVSELRASDMDAERCVLVAELYEGHARVLDKLGAARSGMALAAEALAMRQRVPGYDARCLFRGYVLLAQLHMALGGLREAQAAHETAAQILARPPAGSAFEASELMVVGAELSVMRAAELGAAERQIRDAMALRAAHMGAGHPVLAQM